MREHKSQRLLHAIKSVSIIMSRNARNLLDPLDGNANYQIAEVTDYVPNGFAPDDVDLISALRTDLDSFTADECAALRWHGASVADARIVSGSGGSPPLPPRPALDRAALARGRSNSVKASFWEFWKT